MNTWDKRIWRYFSRSLIRMMIITICIIIITSSMFLFITDRGNVIGYTNEKLNQWENPTYQQMIKFIENDNTNLNKYIESEYECKEFTIELIKKARESGYRAGYVTLTNQKGPDHAIVCFQSDDKGLYFVEPQNDYLFSIDEMESMIAQKNYHPLILNNNENHDHQISDYQISWYMII